MNAFLFVYSSVCLLVSLYVPLGSVVLDNCVCVGGRGGGEGVSGLVASQSLRKE